MQGKVKTENSKQPAKFRTEELLKSKALKGYQKDFMKALLVEPEYTIEEAREILDRFFGKGDK